MQPRARRKKGRRRDRFPYRGGTVIRETAQQDRWPRSLPPVPACWCACATRGTRPPGGSSSICTPRWSTATHASRACRTPTRPTCRQEVLGAVAGAVGRLEYDPQRGAFRNWLFTVVRRKLSNWRCGRRPTGPAAAATPQPTSSWSSVRRPKRRRRSGRPSGNGGCSPGPASRSAATSRPRPGRRSGGPPSTASPASRSPPTSA